MHDKDGLEIEAIKLDIGVLKPIFYLFIFILRNMMPNFTSILKLNSSSYHYPLGAFLKSSAT